MASVIETYTVITKGKGAPDYSDTVSSAIERSGIRIKYNQGLKIFALLLSDVTNVATTLVGAHVAGQTNLTVADASGFWVTAPITIDPGGVNEETHTIVNIIGNIITIALGLTNNQGAGTVVAVPSPPFSWVRAPLVPGASAHMIDQETGLEMPYVLGAGYVISLVSRRAVFDQDNRFRMYVDGALAMGGDNGGGNLYYEEDVLAFSTGLIDPTASSAHIIDNIFTNIGAGNMYGGATGLTVVEAVGTPPFPTTKTTRCPFCGNKQVESVHATRIKCTKCSKLYIVLDLSGVKGSS